MWRSRKFRLQTRPKRPTFYSWELIFISDVSVADHAPLSAQNSVLFHSFGVPVHHLCLWPVKSASRHNKVQVWETFCCNVCCVPASRSGSPPKVNCSFYDCWAKLKFHQNLLITEFLHEQTNRERSLFQMIHFTKQSIVVWIKYEQFQRVFIKTKSKLHQL